jgi:hypothetical protein
MAFKVLPKAEPKADQADRSRVRNRMRDNALTELSGMRSEMAHYRHHFTPHERSKIEQLMELQCELVDTL